MRKDELRSFERLCDMVGQRYGRLVVTDILPSYEMYRGVRRVNYVICDCDCGTKGIVIRAASLLRGSTRSCGCYRDEMLRKVNTKHGLRGTRVYQRWVNLRMKCHGRGAQEQKRQSPHPTLCAEWDNDFMAFYNWMTANGYDEEHSELYKLRRIDQSGPYSPDNCIVQRKEKTDD